MCGVSGGLYAMSDVTLEPLPDVLVKFVFVPRLALSFSVRVLASIFLATVQKMSTKRKRDLVFSRFVLLCCLLCEFWGRPSPEKAPSN